MFTLKWVKQDGGEELHDVHNVQSDPTGKGDGSVIVHAEVPVKGGSQTLTFDRPGEIFVTNANGRTVARYFLGIGC